MIDFLKSIDWIFLFQVILIFLVWLATKYFYKHSSWLESKKEGFLYYSVLIFVVIPTGIGGIIFVFLMGRGVFKEFEILVYKSTWWGQVLIWVIPILLYYAFKIWWEEKRKKSYLSAKENDDSRYYGETILQKVWEIDPTKIVTYPRFTIYDLTIEKKEDQLIFDSSDFKVVSKAFGLFDGFVHNSILNSKPIKFRGEKYQPKNIRVDLLHIFDDYSVAGHTKIYEGQNVPYNVQVTIEVLKVLPD